VRNEWETNTRLESEEDDNILYYEILDAGVFWDRLGVLMGCPGSLY
jgi:hypothetical protein